MCPQELNKERETERHREREKGKVGRKDLWCAVPLSFIKVETFGMELSTTQL